jgi:hypothetical protein
MNFKKSDEFLIESEKFKKLEIQLKNEILKKKRNPNENVENVNKINLSFSLIFKLKN